MLGTAQPTLTAEISDDFSGARLAELQLLLDGVDRSGEVEIVGTTLTYVPTTPLIDGEHNLILKVSDGSDNEAVASLTFETDATAPVVQIASPTDGQLISQGSFEVGGSALDRVVAVSVGRRGANVMGDQFTATLALPQGLHEILVVATDELGRQGSASIDVTIDTLPPRLVLETPISGQMTNEATLRFAGEAFDASGLASLEIGNLPVEVVNRRFDVDVSLPPGPSLVPVRAVDSAGNVSELSVEITRRVSPSVTVSSPAPLSLVAEDAIDVAGTVTPWAVLTVNGVPAEVNAGQFVAQNVPLAASRNALNVVATGTDGTQSTAKVIVFRDVTPPRLEIYDPPDGLVVQEPTVVVRGLIQEVSAGAVGTEPPTVSVNGIPASISNSSFLAGEVPLEAGENQITVTAVDGSGNVGEAVARVFFEPSAGARLRVASGNLQSAPIDTVLPEPLTVRVTDADGESRAGAPVFFKVSGTNGSLNDGQRRVVATTDASGHAAVTFTLGSRAGAGSQRVLVSAPGVLGSAIFVATALPGAPAHVVVDSGDSQTGATDRPLPDPLVAVVTDSGFNRLSGVEVAFEVVLGEGVLTNGLQQLVVVSDATGKASAGLQLESAAGVANNVVQARVLADAEVVAATFTASGRAAGDPAVTSISGLVLDNTDQAVPGATVWVAGTNLTTQADAEGVFSIPGAPVGSILLEVDGTTTSRPGVWPHLEFEMTTIPGVDNTLGRPIYLLPLDVDRGLAVSETIGGTLTVPEVPGFALEIAPGSVTFPDGGRSGVVSMTVVHNDKVPMVPNFGQQPRFVVTLQPSGAKFDPPAPLTLPNVDGLGPGQVVELYSFDHDLGSFVSIGPGTVSEDGTTVTSNPGVGVLEAGWHCSGLPSRVGTPNDCPECAPCNGSFCEPVTSSVSCDDGFECTFDDHCEGADCVGTWVEVTSLEGPCVAAIGESATFTATSNYDPGIMWFNSDGSPSSQEGGASFSTSFLFEGDSSTVTAGCGDSEQQKSVTVRKACSALEEPRLTQKRRQRDLSPFGNAFGHVSHPRPFVYFLPCVANGEWCYRLGGINQVYNIGTSLLGRTDVGGPLDPVIGPDTCQQILSDFTPTNPRPGAPGVLSPPYSQYISEVATLEHEEQHVLDYENLVLRPLLEGLAMFAEQQPCSECPTSPAERLKQEFERILQQQLDRYIEQKEQLASVPEEEFLFQLTEAIRFRAREEGWPAACQ